MDSALIPPSSVPFVGHKPRSLDWSEAAALPLTAITAWEGLFDRLNVGRPVPGSSSILIIGGAGGVGSIAVQLARQLTDITVIATASRPETRDWVRELGAHHVLDHSKPLSAEITAANLEAPGFVFSTTHTAIEVIKRRQAAMDTIEHISWRAYTSLARRAASRPGGRGRSRRTPCSFTVGIAPAVAITHFTVQIIGRGDGRSAVLSAAYRHCARMEHEAEGRTVDYSNKRGLIHDEFLLPPDAPAWARALIADRSASGAAEAFWNTVEAFEKRADAQFAREAIIALPVELTPEQNIALMRQFVDQEILAHGQVADWVYHDEPGNPHVHLMTTLRPLAEDGFGGKKVAVHDEDGQPVRTKAGKIRYALWSGDKQEFLSQRARWIDLQNHHLALAGLDVRVDGRSYAERGIDLVPTTHIALAALSLLAMTSRWWSVTALALASCWIWSAANWTAPPVPPGWVAVDLAAGARLGRTPELDAQRVLMAKVEKAAASGARVILLPESALGLWTPTLERFWVEAVGQRGITMIAGAAVVRPDGYENVLVEVSDSAAGVLYRERMPVPVSMWQPWRSWMGEGAGAHAGFFNNPVVEVEGRPVAALICYEQLIVWPFVQSMLHGPKAIITAGNGWWTAGTNIIAIQRSSSQAWARLFGLPLVTAFNI